MLSRKSELLSKLSVEELASLRTLCSGGCGQKVSGEHAEKLLGLGLAELTCGGLGPSCAGRNLIACEKAQIAAE